MSISKVINFKILELPIFYVKNSQLINAFGTPNGTESMRDFPPNFTIGVIAAKNLNKLYLCTMIIKILFIAILTVLLYRLIFGKPLLGGGNKPSSNSYKSNDTEFVDYEDVTDEDQK